MNVSSIRQYLQWLPQEDREPNNRFDAAAYPLTNVNAGKRVLVQVVHPVHPI